MEKKEGKKGEDGKKPQTFVKSLLGGEKKK